MATIKKKEPLYYAALALQIPRKGVLVQHVFHNKDYPSLVKESFEMFAHYASTDLKFVKAVAEKKGFSISISHGSWKKPYTEHIVPGKIGIERLILYCLGNAIVDEKTLMEMFQEDNYLSGFEGIGVVEGSVET